MHYYILTMPLYETKYMKIQRYGSVKKEAILCIISYCVQSLFSSEGSSSTANRQVVEMFT